MAAALARMVNYCSRVVVVPLSLAILGVEGYGSWQAIAAVLSWMGLDFGMSAALTTISGDLDARRAFVDLKRIISATVISFTVFGLITLAALWGWIESGGVSRLVSRQLVGNALGDAAATLLFCGLLYAISAPAKAVAAVAIGVNLGYLDSAINALAGIVTLVWLFLLPKPNSLFNYGVASILPLFASYVIGAIVLFIRLRPDLRPSVNSLDRSSFEVLLRRSGPFWFYQTADLTMLHSASLILAGTLGPEAVPLYSTCNSLYSFVPNLIGAFVGPYLPAFCGAVANDDWSWILKSTRRNVWMSALLAASVAILLGLTARLIVGYWTGGRLDPPLALVVSMGIVSVSTTVNSVIAVALLGIGQIWRKTLIKCVAAAVLVAAGVFLSAKVGVSGMAMAAALSGLIEVGFSICILNTVFRAKQTLLN
jgi:O-antigen/teichoic acid export membrane protein